MNASKKFLLFLFLLGAACPAYADAGVQAQAVEDLSDRSYLPKIIERLQKAHETIEISMYQILLSGREESHPVFQILQELARAKARGVRIRVLLNSRRDYDAGDTVSLARSLAAVDFLMKNGVEVVFADPSRRVHDKVIIIDGRYVVQGSMNWTRTALVQNWESAALIDSPPYAAAMSARIRAIPLRARQKLDLPEEEGKTVEIPTTLMTEDRYFPGMLEDKDERIFEFYLRLLNLPDSSHPLLFSDAELFKNFRLDPSKSREDNRREALRLLKKLEAQGLIALHIPEPGAGVQIRRIPIVSSGTFSLPAAYFEEGWSARMSFAAEFFYFIARLEMSQSPSAPWWWRSEEELSQRYHIHHTTLAAGMLELQRANLLEIVRDDAPAGRPPGERLVNRYRVNPLVDPAKQEEAFKKLAEKYGEKNLQQARAYADQIDEPNDPEAAAWILRWMETYPVAVVQAAFTQVAVYEHNNPRRSLAYVKAILQAMKYP